MTTQTDQRPGEQSRSVPTRLPSTPELATVEYATSPVGDPEVIERGRAPVGGHQPEPEGHDVEPLHLHGQPSVGGDVLLRELFHRPPTDQARHQACRRRQLATARTDRPTG